MQTYFPKKRKEKATSNDLLFERSWEGKGEIIQFWLNMQLRFYGTYLEL